MGRPKKVVAKTETIEKEVSVETNVSENQEIDVTETIEKEVSVEKGFTKCEVLMSFTDRKEHGGLFHRKGEILNLENERLENAINGRIVKKLD